jgi:hypothetical protein|tara:strand:+ start:55664 stop:56053 length:390 start_codon:yes stop_codon:yes gene_type:complete
MKTLCDYTKDAQSALFDSLGAFFAFSDSQLNESKKQGIEYCSLGNGLIVPKEHAQTLVDGLNNIGKKGIEQDLAENGKHAIIRRELFNYECFYVCDISDCVDALSSYGIGREEIQSEYYSILANEENDL